MTRLPELHRELVAAAQREQEHERELGWVLRLGGPRDHARRLRVLAICLGVMLMSATIALAASGVLPTGSPAPGNPRLEPNVGVGMPTQPGAARLLPLRVADPDSGLPWGMRIVRTSREEACLQVGRVQDGKLGELGIDGAFDDDGMFHPLPLNALPNSSLLGTFASDANTSCGFVKLASTFSRLGMKVNAAEASYPSLQRPASDTGELRDVYYGVLGPQAVSVTYRYGGRQLTVPVVSGSGAYLIVLPYVSAPMLGRGGASSMQLGQMSPNRTEPLTSITYRIDGKICQRMSPNAKPSVADPCPEPHSGPSLEALRERRELHRALHVRLLVEDSVVTGAKLTFRAPYAVTGVGEEYTIFMPSPVCHPTPYPEGEGGTGIPLDRNIRQGALVSTFVPYPFRVRHSCGKKTVTFEAVFTKHGAPGRTIVAKVTVRQPPHTRVRGG